MKTLFCMIKLPFYVRPRGRKLQRASTGVNWSLREHLEACGRPKERAKRRYCKRERQGNDLSLLINSIAKSMCNLCTIVLSKEIVTSLIMQSLWRGDRLHASNPQCGVNSMLICAYGDNDDEVFSMIIL